MFYKIDVFYEKIKNKFQDKFKQFFIFFENTYLNKGIFSDHIGNYYNYLNINNNME